MMKMVKIFALPFLAVLMASAANADIVAESLLSERMSEMVATDQGSTNANKAMVTNDSGQVAPGAIVSGMIDNGTIVNEDVNANAAIAQSKIDGLETALTNAQQKIPSGSENSATLASIWVE